MCAYFFNSLPRKYKCGAEKKAVAKSIPQKHGRSPPSHLFPNNVETRRVNMHALVKQGWGRERHGPWVLGGDIGQATAALLYRRAQLRAIDSDDGEAFVGRGEVCQGVSVEDVAEKGGFDGAFDICESSDGDGRRYCVNCTQCRPTGY